MQRDQILKVLSQNVSAPRLAHCIRVEDTAWQLADRFQVFQELVTPAALLHDLCREYSIDSLLQLAGNFGIVIDEIERHEPLLLHGIVAARIVQTELGIAHPDVLEAISFHITGAPGISPLARLIFVADFIEPGRSFEAASLLRSKVWLVEPEELLLDVYHQTLNYLIKKNFLIHPRTINGRNELVWKGV